MLKYFHHWLLPVLAAIFWWGMLIALLACWGAQGEPVYEWMQPTDQTILYISDIAATNLQPIFISCSGMQGLLFVLAIAAEMYLRDNGRLRAGSVNRSRARGALIAALSFAIIGELGILFVSIFNIRHFDDAHDGLLVIFIVFVGISSLSSIAQMIILGKDYPRKRHVMVSLYARTIWFIIELGLAIAFAACHKTHRNAASVCEWLISFIYPFYMFIMSWDLWPAHDKIKGHYPYNGDYPLGPAYEEGDQTTLAPTRDSVPNDEKLLFPPQRMS